MIDAPALDEVDIARKQVFIDGDFQSFDREFSTVARTLLGYRCMPVNQYSTLYHHVFIISPNSTCCFTSRHVTSRHERRVVRVVTSMSRLSCVSRRGCSNMADDVEAVVLACTSLVFCALDLHLSCWTHLF